MHDMELELLKTKRKMLSVSTSSSAENFDKIEFLESENTYEATGTKENVFLKASRSFHAELLELQEKNECLEEFVKQKDVSQHLKKLMGST